MATKGKRTAPTGVATNDTDMQTDRRHWGPSLNHVSVIGRLATDPQFRYTPNGVAVANFRIANNGTDEVQFHTV
jgi:hypothetical protein